MSVAVLFVALLAGLLVAAVVAAARHDKAAAWRRDVALAIEIAHSYRKGARR